MSYTRRQLMGSSACLAAGALVGCSSPVRTSPAPYEASSDPREAFLAAVRDGDLEAVRRMLAGASSPSGLAASRTDSGRSAYCTAWLGGHSEVAELLQQSGPELDLVESVLARAWPRVERASADELDRPHPIGGGAFWAAARCGTPELYRLRALGADPNLAAAEGAGTTPARAAMQVPSLELALIAATDVLGNRGRVNDPQPGGDSVLHGAVRRKDARLVRLAIRKGAEREARDERGRTASELALELGWFEGVQLLSTANKLPRDHTTSRFAWNASRERVAPQDLGDLPRTLQNQTTGSSHFALDQVRALLQQEPRLVWSISGDGELAIEACGHTGNRPIMRLHLDHGAPLSLPTAISLGDLEHARFLLDEDSLRVDERGPHDFPVLWYAAIGGDDPAAAELLLERGCDLEQESLGATCLHWAVFRKRMELLHYLAERGAELEAVGYKWEPAGQTPLQLARALGSDEFVEALRQLGARA